MTKPSKGVSLFRKVLSCLSYLHNLWKPISVPYMFPIAGVVAVAHTHVHKMYMYTNVYAPATNIIPSGYWTYLWNISPFIDGKHRDLPVENGDFQSLS